MNKKYYFYVIKFTNGIDEWEIRDVTWDKEDFSEEILKEDFNEETNPTLFTYEEITLTEFNILKNFL